MLVTHLHGREALQRLEVVQPYARVRGSAQDVVPAGVDLWKM